MSDESSTLRRELTGLANCVRRFTPNARIKTRKMRRSIAPVQVSGLEFGGGLSNLGGSMAFQDCSGESTLSSAV
jgi:hypothetical protein